MKKKELQFSRVASTFQRLEDTASNLAMIDILADLFSDIGPDDARRAAYLMRGKVSPDYYGPEFGLANKLVIRALAQEAEQPQEHVEQMFNREGDLGNVAEKLNTSKGNGLSLREVFERLERIAHVSGSGSQEEKINALAALLSMCSPVEAKYAVRIVLGTLRLGVGEMTFLYGLSKALSGTKEKKKILESAFNVFSDLGEVAYQAVQNGIEPLADAKPVPGIPIRMMLAQRVQDLPEVKKHIPGMVQGEYKYDGERIQAHILKDGTITLYSRRHEDITHQFPDVIEAIKKSFQGKEAIVEGEVVAIDQETGKLKDFQTLMRRRRKHDVAEYVKQIPVRYFLFDILYLDGASLLKTPLAKRRETLEKTFLAQEGIGVAEYMSTMDAEEIEGFFAEAAEWGAEGTMIKNAESWYEAGSRGWNWIKFKKDYQQEVVDTFDLVVVGGLYGMGRRAGTYGSLLVAAYDPNENKYYTFTKVGAGFTDEDLERIPKMLDKYKLKEKHRLVETGMEAEVWFEPAVLLELSGAEITVSPVHAVAKENIGRGGLALRFPRFLRWRDDKTPEQATTVREIYDLYQAIVRKKK